FVYKAHPAAHIGIRVGGCNAVDDPKDKQDVGLFLAGALKCPDSGFESSSGHRPSTDVRKTKTGSRSQCRPSAATKSVFRFQVSGFGVF
ncbi:MAG: hypothetical protein AB1Z20_08990, partial [Desulfobacterales bacterium]